MKNSRTAQLILHTVYCTLGLMGCIACIGIFDDITQLHVKFYVYFTNLSNFLCIGVMAASFIQTVRRKEDGPVTALPLLKFTGMLGILLTFLVFNFMLAGAPDRNPQLNWRVGSLLFHVTLPILYILDWFLFYERGKTKWYYPLVAVGFPLAYVGFIFLQAAIMNFDSSIMIPGTSTPLIYPYFFLNLETQGTMGVVKWVVMLFSAFIAIGYMFVGIDKLLKKKGSR